MSSAPDVRAGIRLCVDVEGGTHPATKDDTAPLIRDRERPRLYRIPYNSTFRLQLPLKRRSFAANCLKRPVRASCAAESGTKRRCRMRRHRRVVAFSIMSDEDQVPANIVAFRTLEGVVLAARDLHGPVSVRVYQYHPSATRNTTHRTSRSPTTTIV